MRLVSLFLLLTLTGALAQDGEFVETRWVTILTATKTFDEARADAKTMARESGLPFSMEGRVFDRKRGLIYPDTYEDEVFAGGYAARRYNEAFLNEKETEYLSIERSDGYEGFRPGYYIVVAGVYDSSKKAAAQAERFKKWAPTAYAKKTKIYMGCLH